MTLSTKDPQVSIDYRKSRAEGMNRLLPLVIAIAVTQLLVSIILLATYQGNTELVSTCFQISRCLVFFPLWIRLHEKHPVWSPLMLIPLFYSFGIEVVIVYREWLNVYFNIVNK